MYICRMSPARGQLGDYYLNRSGMVDMPEEWKAGIFLPRFGLHIANTEHGVFNRLRLSGEKRRRVAACP